MQTNTSPIRSYLIVEDDDFSRRTIERFLNSFGECNVYQAEDGQQAIDFLSTTDNVVDVIISDFLMPVVNGLELLKSIRSQQTPAPHDTPFVMLTAKTERQLAGLALSLDVDTFLTKPVSRKALELLLNRISGTGFVRPTMQPPEVYLSISLDSALASAK